LAPMIAPLQAWVYGQLLPILGGGPRASVPAKAAADP